MRKIKLFLACLLMAVLSIGQVWGAAATVYTSNVTLSSATKDGSTASVKATDSKAAISSTNYDAVKLGSNGNAGNFYIEVPASTTTLTLHAAGWNGKSNKLTLSTTATGVSISPSDAQNLTANSGVSGSSTTYTITPNNDKEFFTFTLTGVSAASIIKIACTERCLVWGVNAETGGSTPTPSVSADPEEVTNVAAEGVTDQTIDLTYENITDYVTEVSVHPNADGTGTLNPAWLTASVSDADDYATITYSVSANDGAARTAYIKVYTTDGDKEAETIIPVSQVKYSAPTGTFELLTGDLAEGDYVFVVDAKAMTNSVSSSRLTNTNVTISANQIENPDESIIWHVAASGDYWTIYNAAAEKYAASTGVANKAQMLDDGTDDKAKWSVAKTGNAFNFQNKANAAGSVNAKLQRNGDYGWACYSAYSNISLYKKQVAGQPATPTFSVAGGNYESAQTVEISCETVGATIHYTLDGTKPTSSSPTYSTALNISSTTTVKAVAIKDDVESTVATATYTIVVWQTVDEIWSSITSEGPTNANVWGYVSQANVGGYNNNYYISVDGSLTANQLEIYKGDNAGNTVAVGDKVHVNGDLTIFNEIKEFKQNTGVIVHYAAKGALQSVAVSGTPIKTEYAANEDFDPAGLKVYGTYANGFIGEITEGITWGNDLTGGKVTESTTVHVTATVSGITNDPAYDVPVTVAAKTLVSIAVGTASYTIYTGEALPQPVVTATFSEGEPEDVSAFAVYDSESVFDTEVIDNPDPQTITVSYTFGGETKTTTYTVSVQDYENANDAPYSVTEALHIITAAIGNVESAREIVVTGTVSVENISGNKNRYKISDGVNELLVYAGKGFNNETFTNTNYPKVNDVVKVKGKVINYNNNTPEFVSAKSYLLSQIRPSTLAIEDVASFEVGTADLAVTDLTVTTPSDGDITFVSGDDAVATIEANAIHAVAPGTVTITANLAATENVDALNYAATSTTFSVTVVAPATKYAITFDGNGNTGGSAPEAIADKAAGEEVTLPANSYTKTGYTFTGWKVYDENEEEVTVTANAFEMPASPVTIKAQWAEIPVWAYTYTSNVAISSNTAAHVTIGGTDYDAAKTSKGASATITLPQGVTKIHLHLVAWSGEAQTVTVSGACFNEDKELTIIANDGVSGGGTTYDLGESGVDYYFSLTPDKAVAANEVITISAAGSKRFVLFGVNQEGGALPVLDHIAITGTMTNTTGWKTGDNITPAGLTVNAYYTLNEVMQEPVDVTTSVVWSHDALIEDQTEVTLTATYTENTIVKSANVNVTIEAVETGDPTITTDVNSRSWTVEKDAAIPDAKTFAVTLKNIASATVTLGGDNPEAFNVSPSTLTASGNITVSVVSTATVNTYSATITIKDDASETSKTVNVNLTVNAPVVEETAVSTTSEWVAAEDADLVDGAEVLITGATGGVTYAIGVQNDNNRAAVAGTLSEGVFTPGENTMSFTLVAQEEEGVFALQASNGEYLYAASSSKNYLKRQATLDDNAKWTLTATSAVANGSNTHNDLKFNATNSPKIFSCYTGGQTAIQFYVPKPVTPTKYSVTVLDLIDHGTVVSDKAEAEENETVTLTITADEGFTLTELWVNMDNVVSSVSAGTYSFSMPAEDVEISALFTQTTPSYTEVRNGLNAGEYYTMCLDKTVTAVQGGTIWRVLSKAQNGTDIILEEVEGTLDAGRPYIFFATATTLEVAYTGAAVGAPITTGNNGLVGSFSQAHIDNVNTNYIIYNNELYYVNTDNVYVGAHRAYIDMTAVPNYSEPQQGNAPRRRVTMHTNAPQVATGIDALNASDAPVKVLINGQLFILRGEKMYNVNGQLVK